MKKILFATLFALSLFGCTKDGGEELTNITLWFGPSSSDSPPPPSDWGLYKKVRDELGINLKLVPLPAQVADQNAKIEQAVKSHQMPDIFMVNSEELLSLVKRNEVSRVDKMYSLMPERTRQMYDADARRNASVEGIVYGLSQSGSIAKNEGVFIRKDWLDKLNLEIPKTTEEFLDVMRHFTNDDPDGNGKNDTFGFGAFLELSLLEEGLGRRFNPFFGAFGVAGTFDLTQKNAGLNIHKSEYYDALEFVSRLVSEKVIDPNWVAYGKDDFRNAWKSGRFGIMREQNAAYGLERGYKPFDEKFPEGEWIVIDPPIGPSGKCSVGNYTQGYRTYAVSRRAAELGKLPAIARLLEWMSTSGYYYVAYGEEGVNYILDEDGNPTAKGLPDPELAYSKEKAAPFIQLRNLVFYNSDKELVSRYPTWTTKNGKKISALTTLRDMQSRPWTPTIGAERLPAPSDELKKFYEQGVLEFVTGKRSLTRANWDDWVREFDKRGGTEWEKQCIEYARENQLLTD